MAEPTDRPIDQNIRGAQYLPTPLPDPREPFQVDPRRFVRSVIQILESATDEEKRRIRAAIGLGDPANAAFLGNSAMPETDGK